jgi:diguanylate cyclase (GGDEF)-like protein
MEEQEEFRILIVNSDDATTAQLKELLGKDYAVVASKTGAGALEQAEAHKPDLVLLDVLLPDTNGFDLLLNLKTLEATRGAAAMFIAGQSCVEDEEKGFTLGAVDYIAKPFNGAILRARVGTHLKILSQIRAIERMGLLDALTDIPNRRSFDQRLQDEWRRAWRRQSPLSLLMLDVDKFKVYNDTYGHPQGDRLLQFVGKALVSCVRRPTDMAARIGGEEFAVILGETCRDGALVVAEHIRAVIEAGRVPCVDSGGLVSDTRITVSIGVNSLTPGPDLELGEFIRGADKNLYAAKESGRNKVIG